MGDVTITQRDYDRMKEAETKARAEAKLAREQGERAGVTAWKEGRKGESLKLIGGANAPVLQAIFAGAASYFLATSEWFNGIGVFKDHWWLKPLVWLGIGYWFWRRQSPWASAILAAGAAMFAQAWKSRPTAKKDNTTQGPDDEAGRWDWSEDTYGRGRWIETPSGGRAYMTQGAGARAAERIAERVFEHARAAA